MIPEEDVDQDVEIELVEQEPPFLHEYVKYLGDLNPIKIIKNSDGSMAQAAMVQGALAKERREYKMIEEKQKFDSMATEYKKSYIDPLPDGK